MARADTYTGGLFDSNSRYAGRQRIPRDVAQTQNISPDVLTGDTSAPPITTTLPSIDDVREKFGDFPELKEIKDLEKRFANNLPDIQGTRSRDEARLKELRERVERKKTNLLKTLEKQEAGIKLTPAEKVTLNAYSVRRLLSEKGLTGQRLTPAQITTLNKESLDELRKEAGTFGAGLSPVKEMGILRKFVRDSNIAERQAEKVSQKTQTLQQVETSRKELPFERTARLIPEVAGKVAERGADVLGFKETKFSSTEVPLRQTISTDTTGRIIFDETKQQTSKKFGDFVKDVVSVGQFAVPYLGTALFLGMLAERPILTPSQFKQDFQNNPVQTTILYSLGLVGLKGGLNTALRGNERKAYEQILKNAKTDFIAVADEEALSVLSNTKIGGRNFLSKAEIKKVGRTERDSVLSKGVDFTLSVRDRNLIEAQASKLFVESKNIKGSVTQFFNVPKSIRPRKLSGLPVKEMKLTKKLSGQAFETLGASVPRLKITFSNRRGFNIQQNRIVNVGDVLSMELVNPSIIKSRVVGIITPTQAENLFKVLAGNKKLRIYKSGGVNYVFNPNVKGWLKVKPEGSFIGKDRQILIKRYGEQASAVAKIQQQQAISQFKKQFKPLPKPFSKKLPVKSTGGTILKTRTTQAQIITPKPKASQMQIPEVRLRLKPSSLFKEGQRVATTQRTTLLTRQKTEQKLIPLSISGIKGAQKQQSKLRASLKQRQLALQKLRQTPKIRTGTTPKSKPKTSRLLYGDKKIGEYLRRMGRVKPLMKREVGYNVFYKRHGTFRKINKRPISKTNALNLGAEVVDRSLANTFKLGMTNRPAKKPLLSPRMNYFRNTQRKFRDYKIRNGRRIPLKNTYIERRKYRLDIPTEVKRIQADRYLAMRRKKRMKSVRFKRL